MDKRGLLDEIGNRLDDALRSGGAAAAELRGRIEGILREGMAELSEISREEFDAQVRALERAEKRIGVLEEAVAALEGARAAKGTSADATGD